MRPCERVHARVDGFDACGVELIRQRERDERVRGCAGHRSNIAETTAECLVTNLFRRCLCREVNALDHGVGLEEHEVVRQAKVQHRAIVPRAGHHGIVGGQRGLEALDEIEFLHGCSLKNSISSLWKTRAQ